MKTRTALIIASGMFFLGIAFSQASIDRGPPKTAVSPPTAPAEVEYDDPVCELAMR